MAVSINYLQFDGFAVAPDDVQEGEAETQEVSVLRNGREMKVQLVRKSLTVRLRGITQAQAAPYIQAAQGNKVRMILGSEQGADIYIGAFHIRQAVLIKAKPSLPVNFAGTMLLSQLELEYHSLVFI